MKFIAEIDIMPHKELLDPAGKTVLNNLKNLDISGVADIRMGKHVTITLEADNESEAAEKVEKACKNLLANIIMEKYEFSIQEAE